MITFSSAAGCQRVLLAARSWINPWDGSMLLLGRRRRVNVAYAGALHQRPQPRPLRRVPPHEVRIDPQRELRVRVPELGHDRGRVLAAGDEDRGEGVAELVGGDAG